MRRPGLTRWLSAASGVAMPTPLPSWYGLNGYSVVWHRTANLVGLIGSVAGFWAAQVLRIDTQAVANAPRFILNAFQGGGSNGWDQRTNTTNAAFQFGAYFGAGSYVAAPVRTIAAGDVGKLALVVGVYDAAAQKMRLYVNGVQSGTGTTIATAYRPSAGSAPTAWGGRADGGSLPPGPSISLFSVCGGNGFVPSDAELLAQFQNTRDSQVLQPIAGKTTSMWQFPSVWPTSPIVDTISGADATLGGGSTAALTLVTIPPTATWM